jgi:DNA-binding MarR family transcriptional regulator
MTKKSLTDSHATLGALLRHPYEWMSEGLYPALAARGFDDVRPAFSVVLRNLPATGARVSDLAARAGMTKQSMGYLVDQMLAAGLVDIAPDPQDRRANTVRLTTRGEQVVASGIELSKRFEAHLAQLVGARKIEQLRSILLEIQARLDESPAPPQL